MLDRRAIDQGEKFALTAPLEVVGRSSCPENTTKIGEVDTKNMAKQER
jgi:hypothetical protein